MASLAFVYFSFEGRISRGTFWLAGIGLQLGAMLVAFALIAPLRSPIPGVLIIIACAWPALALHAKRWHDLDRPARSILKCLIPIVGISYVFQVAFSRGTAGPNRFGDDPTAGYSPATP